MEKCIEVPLGLVSMVYLEMWPVHAIKEYQLHQLITPLQWFVATFLMIWILYSLLSILLPKVGSRKSHRQPPDHYFPSQND